MAKRGLGVKRVWKILIVVGGIVHWRMMWGAGIKGGMFWMAEFQTDAVVSLAGATGLLIWWDFWIGAVASAVWAWARLGRMRGGVMREVLKQFGTAVVLDVCMVVGGPMAVLAGVELWREENKEMVEEERRRKEAKRRVKL